MSRYNYDGVSNLERDNAGQIEFNRRKNVEQDQRLNTISEQLNELITKKPTGFLPIVYYGLTRGNNTYRFISQAVFNITDLGGNIGEAYELISELEEESYVPAIATNIGNNQIKIAIQGDYNQDTSSFKLINMVTGVSKTITLENVLSLQLASYLGSYSAQDNKAEQITVLHDLELNEVNTVFASVDFNNDDNWNWIRIGNYRDGTDGKSAYEIAVDNGFEGTESEWLESLKGETGETGATGATGATGQNGYTPYIQDGYWYINGVNTNVKAEGQDGTDGTNGQSFSMQSGLYSVPANYGQSGNIGPNSETLQQLPTLPQSNITGKGYVVYDPLTTPLEPFYDLYYANNGDTSWTIIHPFSGLKGQDGTNGYTPYIQNGTWYINGVSTGISAVGTQGAQGPKGVNYKGAWVSGSNYVVDDVATYNGSSYYCKQAASGRTTTPDLDNNYWTLFASKGDTGATGATGQTGARGVTPNISMNATSLPAGSSPTVTKSGTLTDPIFTLGIPAASGGGGTQIDTSNIFNITTPQLKGVAFNVYGGDIGDTDFHPTYYCDGSREASIKCSMICLESTCYNVISITGDLYLYDGTKITTSNISQHWGKLMILKSDVTIQGIF